MLPPELAGMIKLAQRLLELNEHATLSTLFSSSGSTYRPLGSMMVSGFPSMIAGGISGGCLEEYVARAGRSLTQEQDATLLDFKTDPDSENDGQPVLGCGGSIEILVERLTQRHLDFLRQLHAASAADAPAIASCVITCSGAGATQSVSVSRQWHSESNCINGDPQLDRQRQRSLHDRQARHGILNAAGTRRGLMYYIPAMTRLVIIGAGNDSRPLCTIAKSLGWHVAVADRRARLATRVRFPEADQVIADDWSAALNSMTFTPQTAVIMMTHSLPDDMTILSLLAQKPMQFLGVLGPPHRREWLLNSLPNRESLEPDFLAKLRGPIGLNLGERSAPGIAVSIVAEILASSYQRDGRPLSQAGLCSAPIPDRAAHA
jgi:xanthine dehydrogenase accessory factor